MPTYLNKVLIGTSEGTLFLYNLRSNKIIYRYQSLLGKKVKNDMKVVEKTNSSGKKINTKTGNDSDSSDLDSDSSDLESNASGDDD